MARAFGIARRVPSGRTVLLTFDDGPHPLGTPAVLDGLARMHARAVFFVTGENADRHPELVREILDAGHELGLHGYRHHTRLQWTSVLLADDTNRALDAIGRITNVRPRLYRPPRGVFTVAGLRLVRDLGLVPLLWSRWGRDWERSATPRLIARRVSANLGGGDVLLLHDSDRYSAPESWRATAAALPAIAEKIASAGLAPASTKPQPPASTRTEGSTDRP